MSRTDAIDFLLANRERRDESTNIELAERIAATGDSDAMKALASSVSRKEIASDVIKVLYEVAERRPELAAPHAALFFGLLKHKNNRIVWGAMTAVGAIAEHCLDEVAVKIDELRAIANAGSVITRDHFVSILFKLSAKDPGIAPLLHEQFEKCPPNQLPMYAERGLPSIKRLGAAPFVAILESRIDEMKTESKRKRIEKVLRKLGA